MTKRYDTSKQWYAIHTYSGYEEKVADSIRQRMNAVDMADKIFDVMVPKEKQIEINNLSEVITGYGTKVNTKAKPITANKVRIAKLLLIKYPPIMMNGTLHKITNIVMGMW
jgi:transcription antitermination factor NusG